LTTFHKPKDIATMTKLSQQEHRVGPPEAEPASEVGGGDPGVYPGVTTEPRCPYGNMPREAGAGHWREWHRGHGCHLDPDRCVP
jgi:hypothetical protein